MFGNAVIAYSSAPSERLTVLVTPQDMIIWERTSKRKIGDGKGMGFEDMARLTFTSLRRTHQLPDPEPTFDQWVESLADYAPMADADPSQPVAEAP